MTRVRAGPIHIEYESVGHGDPLVLIMGIGGQLTDWHPGFVEQLARRFRVIAFDNRDTGLSTLSGAPTPSRRQLLRAHLPVGAVNPPYHLSQMADDVAALLSALDVERAHVVGMSMGGMIAQLVACRHPHRVLSLCSIMSNTSDRRHGLPAPRLLPRLVRRGRASEPSKAEAIELTVDLFRVIGGADWDETEQRARTSASLDRSFNPTSLLRQYLAVATSPDRTSMLGSLACPVLVVHGLQDPLVRPSGAIATARAIPGSRLLMFPGMGHDIPATRHGEVADAIRRNADLA